VLSVELHCHSEHSYDGRDSVDLLLEQASAVGLDAIAVTDHDEIQGSLEAVERAPLYDLVGIPGIEISTAAGHVLALGVERRIPPALTFEETLTRIHEAGGIAVVPHPFQEIRHGVLAEIDRKDLATADAIEVYNSRLLTGRSNRQARRFADNWDLPKTAGSDAHIAELVGQALTKVDPSETTASGILTEISQGRTVVEGHRTPWRISARQFAGGVQRRVAHRLRGLVR
jgi:predicted metal-dependent phosphoesterase TrpH